MVDHGGRGDLPGEKAREEFFSEAQELIDGLGRDLVALDDALKKGLVDPELINDVFRAVHTLKGLSGLFGATRMAGLSHELEDVLDDLRLGKIDLSTSVLDLLFQAVELYGKILATEKENEPEPAAEVEALLVALGQISQGGAGAGAGVVAQYDLDPGLLGVLTEYEEHRLRTNIQLGLSLYWMRVRFSLSTIDSALDDLKARTRPHGEIVTYLPSGAGDEADVIELEILVASREALEQFRAAVAQPNVSVEEVKRRGGLSHPAPVAGSSLPLPPGPIAPSARGETYIPNQITPSAIPRDVASSPLVASLASSIGGPLSSADTPVPPPAIRTMPPPGVGGGRELSLRSVTQTVRVDIRKLDRLMTVVGELAIVRTALARLGDRLRGRAELRDLSAELQRLHRSFDRHLAQMQNGILEVRMVPLGQVFDKLARVVRQISREHDKQVNLVITGAETEIDKLIVEELSDPLMHMIRNAIDHGIEVRSERLSVGKPTVGTIALNAFQKGNHVLIEVEDDGRGMDPVLLAASAVRKGILSEADASELSPKELLNLVFLPGFTTKTVATDLSGRGVGLDVVKTNIGKLGGVVDITSDVGIGTKMTITLPITLAIISVLLVELQGRLFAMPLASVEEAIAFDERSVRTIEGRDVLTVRGASLPICRLSRMFGFDCASSPSASPSSYGSIGRGFVVIASFGERRLGFVVDKLVGQQDIVIKALGKTLKSVRGFAGATELGDQRIALVLDPAALIEEVLAGEKEQRLFAPIEGRN